MNGGRKKWIEEKRELSKDAPKPQATAYRAKAPDASIRAKREHVFAALEDKGVAKLVDVRSNDEYTGKVIAPPGMSETAQRGGHIPTAVNVPWAQAVNEDGTFKSADALKQLYGEKNVTGDGEVIAYCRIGERSSHTWFEWGNLIGAPLEKGPTSAESH
jgi:thiosulfate/3-mercaptopyruvate sulfurtransferase